MEVLFWIAFAALLYVYAGYPLLVWCLGRVHVRPVHKGPQVPSVSIVIAAYNEAAVIARTIENKLQLDYPREKLEVLVVSDGSTDCTDEILAGFADRSITVCRQEPRNGKTAALNMALARATGDIVVFADANSLYDRTALRRLVASFADPAVGYVTGTLEYLGSDGSMTAGGCGAFMKYENFIRRAETRLGSVVGVNGGIDAVRRSLYEVMSPDDLPDLVLPLRVIQMGKRVVYEPGAILAETALGTPRDEYRMRVRVALRAMWTLVERPGLLNPWRHGIYAVQLLSHKVLRYLASLFIMLLAGSSLMLWNAGWIYRTALLVQTLGLVTAVLGYWAARSGARGKLWAFPYYFALVNCAALHAFGKFLRGDRPRVWTPRLG